MEEFFFIIGPNEKANKKMVDAFSYDLGYQNRNYKLINSPIVDLDLILSKRTDVIYRADELAGNIYNNFDNACAQNYVMHTIMILPLELMNIIRKEFLYNSEALIVKKIYLSIPYFFIHSKHFIIYSYDLDSLCQIRMLPCLEKNGRKTYKTFEGTTFSFRHALQRLMRAYSIKCDNKSN